MAFKKYGDPQPVGGYYDIKDIDKPVVCDKCGQLKTVVEMNQDDNKVICECELEKSSDR